MCYIFMQCSLAKKVIIANLLRFSKGSAAENCPFRILLQIIQCRGWRWLIQGLWKAAWNIYMVDPGGLRLKFLAESFPIFTFPAGPRSPRASDSWRSEGEISSGPSQTHTSHSRPFHQSTIETLQELGMLSMLNIWISRTFNHVSDPALMVVFKNILQTFIPNTD